MLKKILALFITAALLLSTASCTISQKNRFSVNYEAGDNGVYLKKFTGTSTDKNFTIADTYQGKPVVELVDFAVANNEYLQVLYIGANVKTISYWAVTNCQQLKSINVSKDNEFFTSVKGVLFSKDMKTILCYPNMNGSKYIIPDGVETIAMNAFYKCSNLKNVILPNSVKFIEDRAFHRCDSLTGIVLGDKVEKIGIDSFSFCTGLKKMFIPQSVKTIGDFAFYNSGNIVQMSMERKSSDGISLGKDWLPRKTNAIKTKIDIAWGCDRKAGI